MRLHRPGPPGQRLRGRALAGPAPRPEPGQRVHAARVLLGITSLPGLPGEARAMQERLGPRVRRVLRLPCLGRDRAEEGRAGLRVGPSRLLLGGVREREEREPFEARVRRVQQCLQRGAVEGERAGPVGLWDSS